MVATNPYFLLWRAERTTRNVEARIGANPSQADAYYAMTVSVQAMWQAMNAMLLAVHVIPDDARVLTQINEEIIGRGVLDQQVFQRLLDAQSTRSRAVYGADDPKLQDVQQLIAWANEVIGSTQRAVRERVASPINKTPGVAGGDACIRDTRIPVWTLVQLKSLGRTDEQLTGDFPGLSIGDLDAAWNYYREHGDEIDEAIAAQTGED
ncbi:MAG TPA: DUF433 domain-containing protein [Tepidisphaeraceae bacterium]|jgi:uncharacterized protein (DUF433 family)|nr:DUF433 domain-containing protein [Tepidisphaeraceae bacterium]